MRLSVPTALTQMEEIRRKPAILYYCDDRAPARKQIDENEDASSDDIYFSLISRQKEA